MRIKSLKLKNYRQFKDVEVSLNRVQSKKDLHIIIGVMGVGKSNLLNAVNWCLYGEEPFLSREDSKKLPQLNTKILRDASQGNEYRMTVEINAESGGKHITFIRDQYFKIGKGSIGVESTCRPTRQVFKAVLLDESGNSKIFQDEEGKKEATEKVHLFVPYGIKDFFFFDGERLDKYFREATGQNIRNAIYQISQVELLDRTQTHMQKVISDLHKDAGKTDPEIEKTRKELERLEEDLNSKLEEINQCQSQVKTAKAEIKKLDDNLRGMPEVEELQKEKDTLRAEYKTQQELYQRAIGAKQEILFLLGIDIMLFPAIEKARDIIREKHDKGEIPPTIDKNLLKKILMEGKCICEREIGSGSSEEGAIKKLIERISLSRDTSQELTRMESYLDSAKDAAKSYLDQNRRTTEQIRIVEGVLKRITDRIEQIDKQIAGYDMIKIRNWANELRKFEELLEINQKRLGVLEEIKINSEGKIDELRKRLDDEIKKETKLADLKNDIVFAKRGIDVLERSHQEIMESMRRKIEKETEEKFFELHWKKETYRNVMIKNDYTVSPVHSMGYDCLGTLSGGEREVLALSFSLALHNISGFDSAIIVDRPFAMVSGPPREFISKIFSQISDERQIILLLTPEDYASDVRDVLEDDTSNAIRLFLSPDEKELMLEAY